MCSIKLFPDWRRRKEEHQSRWILTRESIDVSVVSREMPHWSYVVLSHFCLLMSNEVYISYRVAVFGLCCGVGRKQYLFYKHWSLIVLFHSEQPCTLLELELGLVNKYSDWARGWMTRVQMWAGPEINIHICSGAHCQYVQCILGAFPGGKVTGPWSWPLICI
jgi:hypothetical protein